MRVPPPPGFQWQNKLGRSRMPRGQEHYMRLELLRRITLASYGDSPVLVGWLFLWHEGLSPADGPGTTALEAGGQKGKRALYHMAFHDNSPIRSTSVVWSLSKVTQMGENR